jgi:hypothetical protein
MAARVGHLINQPQRMVHALGVRIGVSLFVALDGPS